MTDDDDDVLCLELYDGTTPVELHLSRFKDFSRTFNWTEEQRTFALANSLTRMACSVLWVKDAWTSTATLIPLLRDRFGAKGQIETPHTRLGRLLKPRRLFEQVGEPPMTTCSKASL